MKNTRKHIGKNWETLGEYEISDSEREIFYKGVPIDKVTLSPDEVNFLEDLKDEFAEGPNQLEEINGNLYETIECLGFKIRQKIENYKPYK